MRSLNSFSTPGGQPMQQTLLLDTALEYAALGIRVFPLHSIVDGKCSCGHDDCGSPGKHPRTQKGVKDASKNAEQIKSWWELWPEANIAIACGGGLLVLDVDGPEGKESLAGKQLPPTIIANTGKGTHYYYKSAKNVKNAVRIAPGLDIRSEGGYVVAPPSNHISGNNYEWAIAPGEIEPANAPEWLVELLEEQAAPKTREQLPEGQKIPQGGRDNALASFAGTMRRNGASAESILAALHVMNKERCDPPMADRDIERIARSVGRYTPKIDPAEQAADYESLMENLPEVAGRDIAPVAMPEDLPDYDDDDLPPVAAASSSSDWNYEKFLEKLRDPEVRQEYVWANITGLARLSAIQFAQASSVIKEIFPKLSTQNFNKAIKQAQVDRRVAGRDGEEKRPLIVVGQQLRTMVANTMDALVEANNPPHLFVRAGELVRVIIDETGRPSIASIGIDTMRLYMSDVANYVRYVQGGGQKDVSPPIDVAGAILDKREWPFPALEAIVEHPIVRPNGEIIDTPGYDPATRLLYVKTSRLDVPAIPQEPTQEEVFAAASMIADVVAEFPFLDGAGLPNVIGMFLTPLVRPAINGAVPMAIVTAPTPGSGKGLLTEVACLIATGSPASMFGAPTTPEEWQKAIISKLMNGANLIVLDNIEGPLGDPGLCMALTAESVSGRILGRSQDITLPHRATWMASGNNVKLRGDMPRRCYWIRLDPETADPAARTFKIADLKGYVREHRGELIAALLTLVRAWYSRGCPEVAPTDEVPTMGSYSEWQRVVGGILSVAGLGGFLSNQKEMKDLTDQDTPAFRTLLTIWRRRIKDPVIVNKFIELAKMTENKELFDAIPEWMIDRGEINNRKLGNALAAREGRRFDINGLRVVRVGEQRRAVRWQVLVDSDVPVELPGIEGAESV